MCSVNCLCVGWWCCYATVGLAGAGRAAAGSPWCRKERRPHYSADVRECLTPSLALLLPARLVACSGGGRDCLPQAGGCGRPHQIQVPGAARLAVGRRPHPGTAAQGTACASASLMVLSMLEHSQPPQSFYRYLRCPQWVSPLTPPTASAPMPWLLPPACRATHGCRWTLR